MLFEDNRLCWIMIWLRFPEDFISDKDFKNFVIYKKQKFETDAAYIDISAGEEEYLYGR